MVTSGLCIKPYSGSTWREAVARKNFDHPLGVVAQTGRNISIFGVDGHFN